MFRFKLHVIVVCQVDVMTEYICRRDFFFKYDIAHLQNLYICSCKLSVQAHVHVHIFLPHHFAWVPTLSERDAYGLRCNSENKSLINSLSLLAGLVCVAVLRGITLTSEFDFRHRLELMRDIYNEDLSPGTPEAKQNFFQCLAGCGPSQNYFNFINLIPSRLGPGCCPFSC